MDLTSINVQGIETVLADQGIGSPVLLLHGWGAGHSFWRNLWPEVVTKFRCIAPDLPGWGDSGKPDVPYTIEWYADWVAALIDAKGGGPATVIGHSMGASIATMLALRHPAKVSRLVIVSPVLRGSDGLNGETRMLSLPGLRHIAYPFTKFAWMLRFISRNFQAARRIDEADFLLIGRGTYASMIRTVLSLKSIDLTGQLGSIRIPTLALTGELDRIVPPDQARLAASIPGARIETLPFSGHISMLEEPAAFNRLIIDFLSSGHLVSAADLRPRQW